ncbi:CotH kinase family protein [Anaerolineales bacterium HSG25]|nr:CotH kinase family protein [Anaerolineales bacterium HSG25]
MQKLHHRTNLATIVSLLLLLISSSLLIQYPPQNISPTPLNEFLHISEIIAVNGTTLLDADGEAMDWVEIHNRDSKPLNLNNYALTDDPTQPTKWVLPKRMIEPDEYLVVFVSGKNRLGSELHTNFKLQRTGEFLGLFNKLTDRWATRLNYPPQFQNVAYYPPERAGLHPVRSKTPSMYGIPASPGAPNQPEQIWYGLLEPVQVNVERGLFSKPFRLTLSSNPAAIIHYTLDGTEPSATHGTQYRMPLWVDKTTLLRAYAFEPNKISSPTTSHSYIFFSDILSQSKTPPNFPSTWGQHAIDFFEYQVGEPVAADYEMDPEIVKHIFYSSLITPALTVLPTLSIVTAMPNMDIYGNPRKTGRSWERPASVEWWSAEGQVPHQTEQKSFQINAGIRIQGGAGRWEFMPKHSFRLFFRDDYGAPKLHTSLFSDSSVTEFETLILRSGVDRSFAGHPDTSDHRQTTYSRDEWMRRTQQAMSGYSAHGQFVHVYLNGLYWGIYNVVERPDAAYNATHLGGDEEDWLSVNHSGVVAGSPERLNDLLTLLKEADMTSTHVYDEISHYLDLPAFADYLILNWYAGNEDWPHNNWYFALPHQEGTGRFYVWDAEAIFDDGAHIRLGSSVEKTGLDNLVEPFFNALNQNPEFRQLLADRTYLHLAEGGALSSTNAQARWENINQVLRKAIIAESARWGDVRYDTPIVPAYWETAYENTLAQMDGNGNKLLKLMRDVGYYLLPDPPTIQVDEVGIITLHSDNEVYYTLDGSDPRQLGGLLSPTASRYRTPITLPQTKVLHSRSFADGVWSAIQFYPPHEHRCTLQITELMYHPLNGEDYEFIELSNLGSTEIPLAWFSLEGVKFTFPGDTLPLLPGSTAVLVRNPQTFAELYPNVPIAGVYSGRLANNGETLRLLNPQGEAVIELTYHDRGAWPMSADGRGDSLININPMGDPNEPSNWRSSTMLHGSPHRLP